jgi:transposase
MIGLPAGTRIWIAAGVTDLRRGFTGLSGMVQTTLQENPFSGHVFVFRLAASGTQLRSAVTDRRRLQPELSDDCIFLQKRLVSMVNRN